MKVKVHKNKSIFSYIETVTIIIKIFNMRCDGLHADKDDAELVQIILKDYFGLYRLRNRILTMIPTKLIRELTGIQE